MSEERFIYGSDKYWVKDIENNVDLFPIDVLILLNEQQATIEEYEDFCLNLCKFLIGKGLVDEYREEYGKEYKIITKWKGCGSDE